MMQIKTAEITGVALDWAVAQAEEITLEIEKDKYDRLWLFLPYESINQEYREVFTPENNWAQGGPIIEREKIELRTKGNYWESVKRLENGWLSQQGKTPLIAAMRCYVASKLGDTVEIPEELL